MQQRRLGDRSVSAIGLGAMPMSVREHNDEQRALVTIRRALDLGVTLIDTADAYSADEATFGHNERLVAKALREYGAGPDDVVVATKGGHTRTGTAWELDGSPAYLRQACLASMERLGVEQIAQRGALVAAQRQRVERGFAFAGRQRAQALEVVRVAVERGRVRRRIHARSAVLSQARARRRSRSTVPSDTSSAAATSGRLRPPK